MSPPQSLNYGTFKLIRNSRGHLSQVPHSNHAEIEAQRWKVTCPRSPGMAKAKTHIFLKIYIYFKDFIYFQREGKGDKHQYVVAPYTTPTGDLVCNLGVSPDWESNQQPFASQSSAQSIEPYQPGLKLTSSDPMPMFFLPYGLPVLELKCPFCKYECY